MSNERYPLGQVIADDLIGHNKVAILLLIAVVITAIGTVWVTHNTRLLITEQSHQSKLQQKLKSQAIHLQLEENSASRKMRIEQAADKFELQPIETEQEIILVK